MDKPVDNLQPTDRQTVQPSGKLPDWSDKEIAAMANVTPAVLADARADALRSDGEMAAILEAKASK